MTKKRMYEIAFMASVLPNASNLYLDYLIKTIEYQTYYPEVIEMAIKEKLRRI